MQVQCCISKYYYSMMRVFEQVKKSCFTANICFLYSAVFALATNPHFYLLSSSTAFLSIGRMPGMAEVTLLQFGISGIASGFSM